MLIQCLVDHTLQNKTKTFLLKGVLKLKTHNLIKNAFFLSVITEWCKFDINIEKRQTVNIFSEKIYTTISQPCV